MCAGSPTAGRSSTCLSRPDNDSRRTGRSAARSNLCTLQGRPALFARPELHAHRGLALRLSERRPPAGGHASAPADPRPHAARLGRDLRAARRRLSLRTVAILTHTIGIPECRRSRRRPTNACSSATSKSKLDFSGITADGNGRPERRGQRTDPLKNRVRSLPVD